MQKKQLQALMDEMIVQFVGDEPTTENPLESVRRQRRRLKKANDAADVVRSLVGGCGRIQGMLKGKIAELESQFEAEASTP